MDITNNIRSISNPIVILTGVVGIMMCSRVQGKLEVISNRNELPFTRRILRYLVFIFFISIAQALTESFLRTYKLDDPYWIEIFYNADSIALSFFMSVTRWMFALKYLKAEKIVMQDKENLKR